MASGVGAVTPRGRQRAAPPPAAAKAKPTRSTAPPAAPTGPAEATEVHTGLLRLALAGGESRTYWAHVDPTVPPVERAVLAFEQRWFGAKTLDRVRYLMAAFALRYDAFPAALAVLRRWDGMDLVTRHVLCHWHLQLSDPLYRRFTSELLIQRRALHSPKVDRAAVLRWVKAEYAGRWSDSTLVQFASKLLSAALEAGLVTRRDPRSLTYPKVPDVALAYLLYLLREVRIEGSLTENPYLLSVGLDQELLALRGRALPGVSVRRMMHLVEFDWAYPDLATWAREVVR
ncbi:MAG TPA: hypothetical protein PLU22_08615 [Polyangiaceae bacterium]|nr:hypothetical protein [Polyangiaceae bacterium]